MATVGDYNLAIVQITVGDFRVQGFAGDDAVTVAPMADTSVSDIGADGTHVTFSAINDNRHEVMFKVRRGSTAFRLLSDAYNTQIEQQAVGAVDPLSYGAFDPISGDKLVDPNMRFIRRPDMGFSLTASDAEFKAILPNPTITYGANISTSA